MCMFMSKCCNNIVYGYGHSFPYILDNNIEVMEKIINMPFRNIYDYIKCFDPIHSYFISNKLDISRMFSCHELRHDRDTLSVFIKNSNGFYKKLDIFYIYLCLIKFFPLDIAKIIIVDATKDIESKLVINNYNSFTTLYRTGIIINKMDAFLTNPKNFIIIKKIFSNDI